MGLFTPAWKSGNEKRALTAVQKEAKQAKLAQMAKKATLNRVRLEAIRRLTDQHVLADIAQNDGSFIHRAAAADGLSDRKLAQNIYVEIIRSDDSDYQRLLLVRNQLKDDQTLLAELARRDKSSLVRKEAVKNLTDTSLLTDIARNDEAAEVRCEAVSRLSDQTLLVDIFNNDPSPDVRVSALYKIGDNELVKKHVWHDQERSPKVRIAALNRCFSDKIVSMEKIKSLAEWVADDPAHDVRKEAFRLLSLNVPVRENSFAVARKMASSGAFNAMMNDVLSAARSGNTSTTPYSSMNASNYLSQLACPPAPDQQMRAAAAQKIAVEAIQYIAYHVDLNPKPNPELLSHENAIKQEMMTANDLVNIQALVASFLINIGLGRMSGTHFPTRAVRLVYLLTDMELLRQIFSLNSRVYEYQQIKTSAEIQFVDLGGQLPGNGGAAHKQTAETPKQTQPTQTVTTDEKTTRKFNELIKPFITSGASLFYDEEAEKQKDEALKKILAEGQSGEKFLLDFLLRDVTISGGHFNLRPYGDSAAGEWNKKQSIVLALSSASDRAVIDKLAEILMLLGKENQFYTVFQPAVAETLGNLKEYNALEKYIASGQNVPAILLAKDILRLHRAGVAEKVENTRDEKGSTPLYKAVDANDIELVKKLLADGADIDAVQSRGNGLDETALYAAVVNGNTELVKLLIEHNANLSAAAWNGTFPLQRAAAMGHLDIVKLLVDNGADKEQKTTTGKTALMWAEQNGRSDIVSILTAP